MALTPIPKFGERQRYSVYDLEWYPDTYKVRLVGVYDNRRGYRSYHSVREFLQGEMTSENSGVTFFAHAGGLADVQFVLEEIMRDTAGLEIEAAFSGSSAITVKLARQKLRWTFSDSYWLLKDKLSKIGKSLGMEKGGAEYTCQGAVPSPEFLGDPALSCGHDKGKCIFWAPMPVLTDYNELDNKILFAGIHRFEEALLDLGGELKNTVASCAMRLFRGKFLDRPIETLAKINYVARDAYVASRVEPFKRRLYGIDSAAGESTRARFCKKCQEKGKSIVAFDGSLVCDRCGSSFQYATGYYVDVNSSFPYSMTKAQPGKCIGKSDRKWHSSRELSLVKAEVIVPEMHVPPLPYRQGERVYFPTGRWTSWFMGKDLHFLEECGGRIQTVYKAYYFEERMDFLGYVETLYGLRQKEAEKEDPDEFWRLVLKYLLNSLYGKTGEDRDKQTLFVNKPLPKNINKDTCAKVGTNAYIFHREADVPHEWVPIAANVTADARRTLGRGIREGMRASDEAVAKKEIRERDAGVYYCDTDAFVTALVRLAESMLHPTELGKFKREKCVPEEGAEFVAPKLYRMGDHIRAKGFSPRSGEKLTIEDFQKIVSGVKFTAVRMRRVREVFREAAKTGSYAPGEKNVDKAVLLQQRPKRRPVGNDTTPWTVKEIQSGDWERERKARKAA